MKKIILSMAGMMLLLAMFGCNNTPKNEENLGNDTTEIVAPEVIEEEVEVSEDTIILTDTTPEIAE